MFAMQQRNHFFLQQLAVAAVIIFNHHFALSIYLKTTTCDFESGQLCGWQSLPNDAACGIARANATQFTGHPSIDYNPGTQYGSYYYCLRPDGYLNQILFLSYPLQQYIANLSLSYYIVGPQNLDIVQINVKTFNVYSWNGNDTMTTQWERTTLQFESPHVEAGIFIESPSLSGGEFGEAPLEGPLFLAIDDITMTFALPCDFNSLSTPGNIQISHTSNLDIPLGQVTAIQFIASSIICPDGPFIYTIENNNIPELSGIFHLDANTGVLKVNATGPYLIGKGVPLGYITVSVYVEGSDFMQAGGPFKKYTSLHYQQDPTIVVHSPSTVQVNENLHFDYNLDIQSLLNSTLHISNIQSLPPSLASNITIDDRVLHGVITHQHLVDMIQLSLAAPSINITITDAFNEVLHYTVHLTLPDDVPPLIFNKQHYIFHFEEATDISQGLTYGELLIGNVKETQDCNDLSAAMNTTDPNVTGTFHLVLIPFHTSNQSKFCQLRLIVTIPLDYEMISAYNFNVTVTNSQGMTSIALVTVLVDNTNEYSPTIQPDFLTVPISDYMPVNSTVAELMASDKDGGPDGVLSYAITEGNSDYFKVQQISNGQANVLIKHSPILPNDYVVQVTVSDQGRSPRSDIAMLMIKVLASTEINCNESLYGPPSITGVSQKHFAPADTDLVLQCNFTSNPLNYPIRWYKVPLYPPNTPEKITTNSHYKISGNKLTIHSITPSDVSYYICNISNQCGTNTSSIPLLIVIQHPGPPVDFTTASDPTQESVAFTWTPPIRTKPSPVTGYVIRLRTNDKAYRNYQNFTYFSASNVKQTETIVTGLKPGTNYTAKISSFNEYFETDSNEVSFQTVPSAPKLSYLRVSSQADNSLLITWDLEYDGGSHDIHMTVSIQSNALRRRRYTLPMSTSYSINVYSNSLRTPVLPFGRTYDIMATISTEHGSNQESATAFVGVQDKIDCQFSLSSSCQWELQDGTLMEASSAEYPQPTTDASGNHGGTYVMGTSFENVASRPLLQFPTTSYICSLSFYYQLDDSLSLILESNNENESFIWVSSTGNGPALQWNYVEIQLEDFPLTLSGNPLQFTADVVGNPTIVSFVAVDNVTVNFCLPCNYSNFSSNDMKMLYRNESVLYIREDNILTIQTSIDNCPNPVLRYTIVEVMPSQLMLNVDIPNQREGVISINDITSDRVHVDTVGYIIVQVDVVAADYKHNGATLTQTAVVNFRVMEKFENCSYAKHCSFENGGCDWKLSDQSNAIIATSEGNSYLLSRPTTTDGAMSVTAIGSHVINDSYCGSTFALMMSNSNLQVSVTGLGLVWYSGNNMVDTINSTQWRNVTVYMDVKQVDMLKGREVTFQSITDASSEGDAFIAIDDVTLHPCIDCEAQDCSCISCIRQCNIDPCTPGNYLSLEVNQCRKCPLGHYCTSWQSLPIPCPPGTYRNVTGASRIEQCQTCSNGTFTIQKGSRSCQPCPIGYNCSDPASLPILSSPNATCNEYKDSLNVMIAAVIGVCIGIIATGGVIAMVTMYYCYQRIKKRRVKRNKEHQMYRDNFYTNRNKHSDADYKFSTTKSNSTILSMMSKEADGGNKMYRNPVFTDDSDDEDNDSYSQVTALTNTTATRSHDGHTHRDQLSKVDWSDKDPFISASDSISQSNMSALIELEDHRDHVWPALNKKNKPKKEETTAFI
jgi:hypothetical protein